MSEIITRTIPLDLPMNTSPVDVSAHDEKIYVHAVPFAVSCSSSRDDLKSAAVSRGVKIDGGSVSSSPAGLMTKKDLMTSTTAVKGLRNLPDPFTKKISFAGLIKSHTKKYKISPVEIVSRRSGAIDGMVQTREMLELKHIGYPIISEFIVSIAKENGLTYTQIQLIGIFDPVPLHLAQNLTLDPVSGKLRFMVRNDPKAEKRFARVAYARIRSTGAIVQSVFPVI